MKWALADFEKISAAHGMRDDEAFVHCVRSANVLKLGDQQTDYIYGLRAL